MTEEMFLYEIQLSNILTMSQLPGEVLFCEGANYLIDYNEHRKYYYRLLYNKKWLFFKKRIKNVLRNEYHNNPHFHLSLQLRLALSLDRSGLEYYNCECKSSLSLVRDFLINEIINWYDR